MTKHIYGIALLFVALAFVSCGAGQDSSVVTIGYNNFLQNSFGPGPAPIDAIRDAVAARYPDIEIEFNVLPSEMRESIVVWMSAEDDTVDIYGIDSPWVLEFGRSNWAIPLQDEIPALEDNFVASGLDVFSHNGNRLGVPFWGSISGIYYRRDILDEYGFSFPSSYGEMLDIIETVKADRPDMLGFTWPGARSERLTMLFADLFYAFGGEYGGNEDIAEALDDEAALEAIALMVSLIEEGVSPEATATWNPEESRRRFVEGTALFHWENNDLVTWLDDPERSAIAGLWGFEASPAEAQGRRVAVTGGFAFAANPYTDNRDDTLRVLEVIASEEVQRAFAVAWGPVQYYEGLYDIPAVAEANPNAAVISNVLEYAINRPPSERYAELSAAIQEEVHGAITGLKSPEEAFNDMLRRIEAL